MEESYDALAVILKVGVVPLNAKQTVLDYIDSVQEFKVMKITDWCYVVKYETK